MNMDAKTFWKNFSLGKELDIAGNFIYNGLKAFDLMDNFIYEDIIFEFFYNIAVGIERLEKILVVLIEHNDIVNQNDFEKSLISHNHIKLLNRISKKYNCGLSNLHNEFLELLSRFYKTMRYDRYSLNNIYSHNKEKISLISFLEKHLNIEIVQKDMFVTQNDWKFKKFIGRVVGKICEVLYKFIDKEATELNIYTYELRSDSKASVIFLAKKYNFFNDDIVWKEILIYLVNNTDSSAILDFIRSIEPLDLEAELVNEYIDVFKSDLKKHSYIDELEEQYYEIENIKERIEKLKLIGNSNVYFTQSEDEKEVMKDYSNKDKES